MKKIAFSTRYGLEQAVIDRVKDMTRRKDKKLNHPLVTSISECGVDDKGKAYVTITYSTGLTEDVYPAYQIGEEVAIAQSYKSIVEQDPDNDYGNYYIKQFMYTPAWTNKMFVKANFMPHRIRIIYIRVERLRDISDEDCMKEGIKQSVVEYGDKKIVQWTYFDEKRTTWFDSPRDAFAALIDRISGRGTWQRNPWVFVYKFELIK